MGANQTVKPVHIISTSPDSLMKDGKTAARLYSPMSLSIWINVFVIRGVGEKKLKTAKEYNENQEKGIITKETTAFCDDALSDKAYTLFSKLIA